MRNQYWTIVFLSFIIILGSFSSAENYPPGLSSVAVQMNYKSLGFRGYGGQLILLNESSGKLYHNTRKMGMNPFIFVDSLPSGNYRVVYLNMTSSGPPIHLTDSSLFSKIKIEEEKFYYLGSYLAKKIKPVFEFHINVKRLENDPEDLIKKKINRISKANWGNLEINYSQRLFFEDSTDILIRKQ